MDNERAIEEDASTVDAHFRRDCLGGCKPAELKEDQLWLKFLDLRPLPLNSVEALYVLYE